MVMENFMPKGLSEVKLGRDWSVIGITAIDENEEVSFRVIGGKLKKLPTTNIIPSDRFWKINKQVQAIKADYEEDAKLARKYKKINWSFDLEKYGVTIEKDGQLTIWRWHTKKDGTREHIPQTLKNIKSAIRQQDHIIQEYLKKKNYFDDGNEHPLKLSALFKKLKAVQPYIEMRRLLLIRAQEQMDTAIRRTVKGLELLLKPGGYPREKCHGVSEKLKRLSFFLNNNWPKPYREKIDLVLPLIKEAKKSAANLIWDNTEYNLKKAKVILTSGEETFSRQASLIGISQIDPIRILAEVDKYNLADEVMVMAKKHLADQYLKYRGYFRLSALLAVAQLVITGKPVNQEEIIKLRG
jgi:hypothetical protein